MFPGGALPGVLLMMAICLGAAPASAQSLPTGWTNQDIGGPDVAGSTTQSGGTWTMRGSGRNIGETWDEFQFAYYEVAGDVDIRVRVASLTALHVSTKAGLMIRESLTGGSRHAYIMKYGGPGLAYRWRSATNGNSSTTSTAPGSIPVWLRMVRSGNTFTGYSSTNGSTWTQVSRQTIAMGARAYVGLATSSYVPSSLATATFTNLSTQITGGGEESLPAPWATGDVGSPGVAGGAIFDAGTFTVAGAGSDVWGASDQFRFVYQQLQGDVEIVARLATLQNMDPWTKAGVMIRESLAANARNAFMIGTGSNGWRFQRRPSSGGASESTGGPSGAAPGWIRLVREGSLLSAYHSSNGTSWALVGTDTIAMASTVYVGLAVTSHVTSRTAAATFTNVTARAIAGGGNQPPSVTLTSPSAGAAFTAPATMAMAATASDTDGGVVRVDFYRGSTLVGTDTSSPYTATWSSAPAGTYSLTAVATDTDGDTTRSAAVSVTVNGSGNTAPSVALTSPTSGASYSAPGEILVAANASDPDGRVTRVDLYRGATLLKSDTTVPYSFRWTGAPAGTYTFTAVAHDEDNASRTSSAVTVTVGASGNQPPSVSISAPATGTSFTAPASILISAAASDADGRVVQVDLYQGSTRLKADTTEPYSFRWESVPAGTYTLTAVARDEDGASRTSAAVTVTVSSSSNQPPSVAIASPTSGATFTAPATVTINANASDADGSVTRVDFYAGSQLIGSDSASPFAATWSNVAAGSYSLTAVARDNGGSTRTSAGVAITVSTAGSIPTRVTFEPSDDHASNVTEYSVAAYRSSTPSTGAPAASRSLGKPTPVSGQITVDISTIVNPLPAGSYYVVVSAVGPGGTTPSSASPSFTK